MGASSEDFDLIRLIPVADGSSVLLFFGDIMAGRRNPF